MVMCVLLALSGCMPEERSDWYDYGNGRLNLRLVTSIRPVLEYELTLATDTLADLGKSYSVPLTEEAVDVFLKRFDDRVLGQGFYRVRVCAYVMFDDFRLELLPQEAFLKRPHAYSINPYLLKQLQSIDGDQRLVASLSSLNGKSYSSLDEFFQAIAATGSLNMNDWWVRQRMPLYGLGEVGAAFEGLLSSSTKERLLGQAEIGGIRSGLQNALARYREIPK